MHKHSILTVGFPVDILWEFWENRKIGCVVRRDAHTLTTYPLYLHSFIMYIRSSADSGKESASILKIWNIRTCVSIQNTRVAHTRTQKRPTSLARTFGVSKAGRAPPPLLDKKKKKKSKQGPLSLPPAGFEGRGNSSSSRLADHELCCSVFVSRRRWWY